MIASRGSNKQKGIFKSDFFPEPVTFFINHDQGRKEMNAGSISCSPFPPRSFRGGFGVGLFFFFIFVWGMKKKIIETNNLIENARSGMLLCPFFHTARGQPLVEPTHLSAGRDF